MWILFVGHQASIPMIVKPKSDIIKLFYSDSTTQTRAVRIAMSRNTAMTRLLNSRAFRLLEPPTQGVQALRMRCNGSCAIRTLRCTTPLRHFEGAIQNSCRKQQEAMELAQYFQLSALSKRGSYPPSADLFPVAAYHRIPLRSRRRYDTVSCWCDEEPGRN